MWHLWQDISQSSDIWGVALVTNHRCLRLYVTVHKLPFWLTRCLGAFRPQALTAAWQGLTNFESQVLMSKQKQAYSRSHQVKFRVMSRGLLCSCFSYCTRVHVLGKFCWNYKFVRGSKQRGPGTQLAKACHFWPIMNVTSCLKGSFNTWQLARDPAKL